MLLKVLLQDHLHKLQAKAHKQIDHIKGIPGGQWNEEELEIELPLLDGRTRLISRRRPSRDSSSASPPTQSMQADEFISVFGDVHPTLLEYFQALDNPSPPNTSSDESNQSSPPPSSTALAQQPMNETLNFWDPMWGNGSTNVFNPEATPTFDQFTSQTVQQQQGANVMKSSYPQTQSPIQPMDMSGFNGLSGDNLTWNGYGIR